MTRPTHDTSMRRFAAIHPEPGKVRPLRPDHRAVIRSTTIFPTTVVDPADSPRVLVSGQNSRKLGRKVVKGPWAGMPLFSLTLEERATCPATCFHWRTCYGNSMHLARRHRHGPMLEATLESELSVLQEKHPRGFVVRLHVLGDFYSAEYARAWGYFLAAFPALRVFGYTAWPPGSPIGDVVAYLRQTSWDRFAVRYSGEYWGSIGAVTLTGGAVTLWEVPERPRTGNVVTCPAQTGATDCCGTCGLCWHPAARDLTIGFIAHGNALPGRPPKRKTHTPPAPTANEEARMPDSSRTCQRQPGGAPKISPGPPMVEEIPEDMPKMTHDDPEPAETFELAEEDLPISAHDTVETPAYLMDAPKRRPGRPPKVKHPRRGEALPRTAGQRNEEKRLIDEHIRVNGVYHAVIGETAFPEDAAAMGPWFKKSQKRATRNSARLARKN